MGGTCTCPDGQIFQVGDNGDNCGSLACVGGISGTCGWDNPGGANVRVTCGATRTTTTTSIYIPGEKGAKWTLSEVLAVKAKLWRIFSINQAHEIYAHLHPEEEVVNNDWTTYLFRPATKMLQLGFHMCFPFKDGTGGCNGCLDWEGIGLRYGDTGNTFSIDENSTLSKHNGLKPAVQLLEAIYTDVSFPAWTPRLNVSLQNSGKSRADLWALAAIVSVEYGIWINNNVCSDPLFENGRWGHDANGAGRHCHQLQGSEECFVRLPRPIKFQTGRRDCIPQGVSSQDPPYATMQPEVGPDVDWTGDQTLGFFRDNFGFNARETVAIMGAHTMGRFHHPLSLFRYVWVQQSGMMFNNQYYRLMSGKREHYMLSDDCTPMGDAWGQPAAATYVTHVRGDLTSGGPVMWFQEKLTCPLACFKGGDDPCCRNLPPGASCQPDGGRGNGTDALLSDDDVWGGCERFRGISGMGQNMISAEIGLFYNFSIDEHKIPTGCPGFENFNTANFIADWGTRVAKPACPRSTFADAQDIPVSQIVELYADNQAQWLSDFIPTLEKMLRNGHAASDLIDGPDQWTDISCVDGPDWTCSRVSVSLGHHVSSA